jgi:hypothetical protein
MRHVSGILVAAVLLPVAVGCLRMKPSLTDPDPANKIPAIRQAGDRRDASAAPLLVKDLQDDDPAVRFYAIRALTAISGGETFGYVYFAEDEQRKPAVRRWQQWLTERGPRK